jgi:hypothetical protein
MVGMLLVVAIAIFVVAMFLGTGLSSYATFSQCQKTDAKSHFKQGSIWAVYPTLAYLIMRGVGRFRVYFERFFGGWVGSERAGWVSIGYGMLLASLAGMYSMVDSSIEEVCVPTIDEATKFRQDMLKRQAEKAAAQEATPAVTS